ncbi:MAG: deoxyribodipyrimidine photolyase [Flammeovirgaceae bacterium]|nr:deoxyribodipyrimidine photolyase [Flammeovirgaceae bacterium]
MKKSIYWFRKNLRLRDNPSLFNVIKDNDEIIFIYIYDLQTYNPKGLDIHEIGDFRKKFMMESVLDLEKNLKSKNIHLHTFEGDKFKILDEIKSSHGINTIYCSKEVGWYEEQDEKKLIEKNFELIMSEDPHLIEEREIPFNLDNLPLIFTPFRKKVEKNSKIRDEIREIPSVKKAIVNTKLKFLSKIEVNNIINHSNTAYPFEGGEKNALERLKSYLWESNNITKYKETRNGLIGTEYSSKFSAYLSTGSISPVTIYHEIKKFEREVKKNSSTYWLIFELMWREFFRYVSKKGKKNIFMINGINGNIFNRNFNSDINLFKKWCNGETGQEFIDANMSELNSTGFMSNRGRQNVASYLINELDLNWTWGAAYFESKLIDYDVASNWCNWMYMAGVGNNVRNWAFNPSKQSEIYDKGGKFRSLWLNKKLRQQIIEF